MERYTKVKSFIESNHRNPSRHNSEERFKYCNWLKHNKILLNAGEMKEDRVSLFENLLEMGEMYKNLSRLLDALSLKAIIVRPSLDGWNSISQTHTLEQMLLEIGEPVYRWHRKEKEK